MLITTSLSHHFFFYLKSKILLARHVRNILNLASTCITLKFHEQKLIVKLLQSDNLKHN